MAKTIYYISQCALRKFHKHLHEIPNRVFAQEIQLYGSTWNRQILIKVTLKGNSLFPQVNMDEFLTWTNF